LAVRGSIAHAQGTQRAAAGQASPEITPDSIASAHRFAQEFYDWYIAYVVLFRTRGPAHWVVLGNPTYLLDADLASALRGDSIMGDNNVGEALDSDPFLWSQDPCAHYEVTEVSQRGHAFRATVRPVCKDTLWQKKRPVLEIVPDSGHWKITNVYYDAFDLRSGLCAEAKALSQPDLTPMMCR
jgi:hypothetical protein